MNDRYGLDSHKLRYHVGRLNDWMKGDPVFPVLIEVSPTGACNHRCVFCAMDFMDYKLRSMDPGVFIDRLTEFADSGVKSIVYAGEGEPLMHSRIADFVRKGKELGIDSGLASNGVLFKPEIAKRILPYAEWIKFSIDAANSETHAALHGCPTGDFDRIVQNLKAAVEIKHHDGLKCDMGVQFLLLPENSGQAVELAKMCRDWGMSYFVAKPYSHHPNTMSKRYSNLSWNADNEVAQELADLSTDNFNAVYRASAAGKVVGNTRRYEKCLGLPFWCYIDSEGNVWGCSCFLKDERFYYGNILENSFEDVWESDKRKRSLEWVNKQLDVHQCRPLCRLDEINQYLWELMHPPEHVNFI